MSAEACRGNGRKAKEGQGGGEGLIEDAGGADDDEIDGHGLINQVGFQGAAGEDVSHQAGWQGYQRAGEGIG